MYIEKYIHRYLHYDKVLEIALKFQNKNKNNIKIDYAFYSVHKNSTFISEQPRGGRGAEIGPWARG